MNNIGIGPFIGDFETEILEFRPFVYWIKNVINPDKLYISTHFNREFLYDSSIINIPINKDLSINEKEQHGFKHKKINKDDFKVLQKIFKEKIEKSTNIYYLKYLNKQKIINNAKKSFEPININQKKFDEKIYFIPYGTNKKQSEILYNKIIKIINIELIGDKKSSIKCSKNFNQSDLYYEILNKISSGKIIICPLSYWTLICNLMNKRVFSFGDNPGLYRQNGIYGNNNKNSFIIPNSESKIIVESFKRFI